MNCPICQHLKRQAIDDALDRGRAPGVVAVQYRVAKTDLIKHLQHVGMSGATSHAPDITSRSIESNGPTIDQPAQIQALTDATRISPDHVEEMRYCRCYWCSMSDYQRLLRAWQHANQQDKERFCADTRTMDIPF